ncbi:MAG TPA: Type 1 glutamine amidotransferase-like domain-containing protein [Ktedonobacteraceae bacterium]|nr:Type 1 glutamine amidotransferase-like domain-containing protein [Ktedonobacteraceae bacterium]
MSGVKRGTIALVGAGEYLTTMNAVDQYLLEQLNEAPRVVVLPTASAPDGAGIPERWNQLGVEHFTQLGSAVESLMLLNHEDANDPVFVEKLASANFIYFSGGKPSYLMETLAGTAAWQAILQVREKGGVIAGCSAGAMVMGAVLFDFPQIWRTIPALDLVPGIAVIPHFDELPRPLTSTIANIGGNKITVVGVDRATALVVSAGRWVVQGIGAVTVFTGKQKHRYRAGDEVPPIEV